MRTLRREVRRETAGRAARAAGCALAVLAAAALFGGAAARGSTAEGKRPGSRDLAVRGGVVHTMAGPPLRDVVILVKDGKIAEIGPAGRVAVLRGVRTLEAAVVTPGLVDAHSVVGLSGYLNQPHDQDQIERSAPIQPELRAIDAYDARERLVEWVRSFGVTTVHTGHAPGEIVSGQTLVAKTRGGTVEEAVIVPEAMLAVTLGEGAVVEADAKRKSPGTRSKAVALLRAELIKAQEYARKIEKGAGDPNDEKRPARDLKLEVLARVLKGDLPLMVTVHRHHDILTALRLREEFGFRMVLDGASEAYLAADRIRSSGVPVILHPTMARAFGERENLGMTTAATLIGAGIPVAIQSGYEAYVPKTRVVLFEAAAAAGRGLAFDRALAAVTIEAARILGVADRVGSVEAGKDGDLALYDGDPFEFTTHCTAVVIEGEIVSETPR